MKLKYYMRGLGIGIILTVLLYTLLGTKNSMTEEEIIAQAKKLGMVEASSKVPEDSEGGLLDKIHENLQESSPQPTKETQVTKEPATSLETTLMPTPTLSPKPTKKPKATTSADSSDDKEKYVYLTISGGMSSDQVAALAKEKGLISNAEEFDQYLIDNGYASRIRVNTYKILIGSDYKTIAECITVTQPWQDPVD